MLIHSVLHDGALLAAGAVAGAAGLWVLAYWAVSSEPFMKVAPYVRRPQPKGWADMTRQERLQCALSMLAHERVLRAHDRQRRLAR